MHSGINYTVWPGRAIFFGSELRQGQDRGMWRMKGFPSGDAIGAIFTGMYVPISTNDMRDVRRDVLACIRKAKPNKPSMVIVYMTNALFLFARGVLKAEDFKQEITETAGSIDVPNVRISPRHRVTVRIVNNDAFRNSPAAADSDGNLI